MSSEESSPSSAWKYCSHENDTKSKYGGSTASSSNGGPKRDIVGYGANPVQPHWPRSAKVALNFVINYEEGSEMSVLHGDPESECLLSDNGPHTQPYKNERNLNIESMYEYGSRCGFWRLHRLFTSRKVPVTVWACGMALERNMEVVGAIKQQDDWEVSSHGYRWMDYSKGDVDEEIEKEHLERTIAIHKKLFGKGPVGLYQGKPSVHTRRLAVEEIGGFLYDSDAYNDDLPYWSFDYHHYTVANKNNDTKEEEEIKVKSPHLIIPYTLVENDMLYTAPNGWSTPDDFLNHLKRTLDYLVMEGRAGQPKMMTVGLHCRLSRPARVAVLAEFVDYAKSYGREVWITTRESIANHWYEKHLPRGCGNPIIGDHSNKSGDSGSNSNNNTPSSTPTNTSAATSSASTTSTSRFSFLGNLKAPRNSQEYKDSLKVSKSKAEDTVNDDDKEEEDVI